jgi:conjugative relaxase-like TrwC/TraI family protein
MIHPRRLSGSPGNIARYYAIGDYYSKGSDEHSEWGGQIASELGLQGRVDPDVFRELLSGKVAGQELGRHRSDGTLEHHPGWDFAVNAPKSVSILALVAQDGRVIDAHEKAVGQALSWIEEHTAFRRRDSGKIVHETTARLIFARFTEYASRELDPHLHTHVVIMNITNRAAGAPMTSVESRAMFAEQMVGGQIYRNALAISLRELGYEIETDPKKGLFEIRGVPADLVKAMSRRAEQINAHAAEHGHSGQAARVASFYQTRGPKEKVGMADLQEDWKERAGGLLPQLHDLQDRAERSEIGQIVVDPMTARRAALFGIRHSEDREAVNNQGHLLRVGLAAHVGEVTLSDLRPLIFEHEARSKLLVTREQTGDGLLARGRTSRKTARLELALARHLALAMDDAPRLASSDRLLAALETSGLTPAQEQALAQLAGSRDRLIGVHGVAGAGKSTLVRAMAKAIDPDIRMLALAPTSSAAANLGDMAGIESRTVASLIAGGGHGIDSRDVLVIDEAGQLGNRQALRLLEISRDTGVRLLLLGDNRQTGAIEQGKAFWLLQRLGLPKAELTESMRQQTRLMRHAVALAREGDYAGSIDSLDKVVSGTGPDGLARDLVSEWTRLKRENRDNTNILVLDNASRIIVNDQIRSTLRREGVIAAQDMTLQVLTPSPLSSEERRMARFYSRGQVVMFSRDEARQGIARQAEYRVAGLGREENGRQVVRLVDELGHTIRWDPRLTRAAQINVFNAEERGVAVGDRIQWRLATKDLGLKNAERGTVIQLDGPTASIRWDRAKDVQSVDLTRFKTWDHGYAETVYSSQSKTYARAYILAPVNSPLVNGQNYYTAITRARFGVKLWTEDPERLADRLIRRTGEKRSALEGLGRLDPNHAEAIRTRHGDRLRVSRVKTDAERRDAALERQMPIRRGGIAEVARSATDALTALIQRVLAKERSGEKDQPTQQPNRARDDKPYRGHSR